MRHSLRRRARQAAPLRDLAAWRERLMNAPRPHPSAPAPGDFTLHQALEKIITGEDLSRHEAEAAMERILTGQSNDAQIAGFLASLRMKGETVDELVGFATVMRRH